MTAIDFIIVLAVGRLFVWFIMINGITGLAKDKIGGIVAELLSCDLCVGFWVFLFLAAFTGGIGLFDNQILDAVSFAAIAALLSHLVSVGFTVKFIPVIYD